MELNENANRPRESASRPPQGDGEIPEAAPSAAPAPRRAVSYGRPESAPRTGGGETRPSGGSPYGGRNYTSASAGTSRPRQPQSRQTPVYTELRWDDLRQGMDLSQAGRQTPAPAPESIRPQGGGGSYFGGFSQEMEEQYYNQPAAPAPQAGQRTGGAAPQRQGGAYAPPRNTAPSGGQPPRTGTYGPAYSQTPPQRRQTSPQGRQTAARNPGRTASPPPQARNRQAPLWNAPPPPRQGGSGTANGGNGHVQYAGRPRRQGLNPLIYVGGFALLALMIFLVARLAGNSSQNRPAVTARPTVDPGVAITSVPSTDSGGGDGAAAVAAATSPDVSPETTPDATPTPSPEPTSTPTGPKAEQLGNLIVPSDWGPVVPERNIAVYDSYFDKACMIGNSLVEGFFMWSGLTNMKCIYNTGATVDKVLGVMDLSPVTLNVPGYYTDIYLMFGLNEVGTDVNNFVQNYKKVVDYIREYQPDANIYVVSVTPVTEKVDKDPNEVQSMERIDRFNAALKEFCTDSHCWYLDIYSMLLDDQGYLSSDYAYMEDGKHFEKSGYVAWADYMKTHYVDAGLLTE